MDFSLEVHQVASFFLLPICVCVFVPCVFQNQAEAHYKGHKHARKLKAIEAQKNRQRRAGEASSVVKERDRDRDRERGREGNRNSTSEAALPALMDTSLVEGSSTYHVCFTLLSSCFLRVWALKAQNMHRAHILTPL